MKNAPLILSIIALVVAAVFGGLFLSSGHKSNKESAQADSDSTVVAATAGIVYVDYDRIFQEYDMTNDLGSVVEAKVKNIQAEVDRRRTKLENQIVEYQEKINKGLMTRSVAEVQGQKLQKEEENFNVFANQKQNEVMEEQNVMMNQIADAIKTFIDKYNAEKGYTMIITNQGGLPVITADPTLNITDEVISLINEEYVKSKDKKNK